MEVEGVSTKVSKRVFVQHIGVDESFPNIRSSTSQTKKKKPSSST